VDEARYGQRRAQLLDQLERIYGELDGGGDLPGGGQGLACVTIDFDRLEIDGVSRYYGRRRALHNVTFTAARAKSSQCSGRTAPASRRCWPSSPR
jgi:hypothetical protein